ncbi:MAG: hypothetical protein A2Y84_00640 [Candidatus Colwellbacteria bacterium RBG_13_48_8]|uniref:Macrocin O-methyltransferase n=1 Tax=Candidatus Colwellbacteria bacterium RBG_13_48_8 TaxID=1797685 RepID=A0A1G1YX89_9BACT|nr:MAG: hypothetical protein A2Y84_00640 [Candidatus Colwellbacteria bacterium RBG_13_48_8]
MNTPRKSERLYLDLMKKTLSFTLWPEPPIPATTLYIKSPVKRFLTSTLSWILNRGGLQLSRVRSFSESQRLEGAIWPGYADTMIGIKRLDNLQYCIETALADGIKGDLIETGVWRGGACVFMRAILLVHGITDRRVFLADSFRGLPKPDEKKYPADKGDKHYIHNYLAVSKEEVENNFRKYDLLDDQVVFLEGWFKDTLPNAPIEKLAVLRLDGDMYGSTIEALESLYPKLSSGGFCIVDDYALKGCRMAVDDYRLRHRVNSEMKEIDATGRYWRKE